MTQLLQTAAYIRKDTLAGLSSLQVADLRGSVIDDQVWQLLETPQTLESLQRAANRGTHADRGYLKETLEHLLDADLIELSPDS